MCFERLGIRIATARLDQQPSWRNKCLSDVRNILPHRHLCMCRNKLRVPHSSPPVGLSGLQFSPVASPQKQTAGCREKHLQALQHMCFERLGIRIATARLDQQPSWRNKCLSDVRNILPNRHLCMCRKKLRVPHSSPLVGLSGLQFSPVAIPQKQTAGCREKHLQALQHMCFERLGIRITTARLDQPPPHLVFCCRLTRHALLGLAGKVGHNAELTLDEHQLAAMVHLVLLGPEQLFKPRLRT